MGRADARAAWDDDALDAQLEIERNRNDTDTANGSGMASKLRDQNKPSAFKTVRKVLGWTLGVGCVGLIGAYAYSKLRDIGADDVADAVVDAADRVADKVDAAVSAAVAA